MVCIFFKKVVGLCDCYNVVNFFLFEMVYMLLNCFFICHQLCWVMLHE